MQVNLHIITLFYTLYNKGVNSVVSICGLQKHEEKNEKKIAKYLVVPNICILSLNAGVNKTLHFFVHARAKRVVQTIVNKGLAGVSFVLFLCPAVYNSREK